MQRASNQGQANTRELWKIATSTIQTGALLAYAGLFAIALSEVIEVQPDSADLLEQLFPAFFAVGSIALASATAHIIIATPQSPWPARILAALVAGFTVLVLPILVLLWLQ